MRNISSLTYLLPMVCLTSWQCGRSTPSERRDAVADQAPLERTDGGADVPEDRGPDVVAPEHDAADAAGALGNDAMADLADVARAYGVDTRPFSDGGAATPDSRTGPDGGSDLTSSDGTIDRGVPDSQAGSGELDGSGQCNDLTANGPVHDVVGIDQPAPVPLGGAIEDGVYYETAAQVFGSDGSSSNIIIIGTQRRMTMWIEGPILQAAFTTSPDGETRWETDRMTVAPDADPTTFGITQLCPGSSGASDFVFHHSFVGTGPGATFTIIYPADLTGLGQTIVLTLTKQ